MLIPGGFSVSGGLCNRQSQGSHFSHPKSIRFRLGNPFSTARNLAEGTHKTMEESPSGNEPLRRYVDLRGATAGSNQRGANCWIKPEQVTSGDVAWTVVVDQSPGSLPP